MMENEIYNEIVSLADSLDDHVTDDEIAFKLRELADRIHPDPRAAEIAKLKAGGSLPPEVSS